MGAEMLLMGLRELKDAMLASPFIASHSLIGTSLLFIADADGPMSGVFLIDFAKTVPLPEGVIVSHSSPWAFGNHEDGLFIGMTNIIKCMEEVVSMSDPASASD